MTLFTQDLLVVVTTEIKVKYILFIFETLERF